jgi:CSLREA domain-containing protein
MFCHNNPHRLPGIISIVFLTVLSLIFNIWHVAQAAPEDVYAINVDTTNDDPSKSACTTVDNDCSLRGAISYANATLAGSEIHITIPAGTYDLSTSGSGEDGNQAGDLDIVTGGTVLLQGAGRDLTFLDGMLGDRVLDNHSGAVILKQLTITHGEVSTGGHGGGGIRNRYGAMTLIDVLVEDNSVDGTNNGQDRGGGIANGGILNIQSSTIDGNQACNGGGVYNIGSLTITGTIIINNDTRSETYCGYGGGINDSGGGEFKISNLNIHSNTAITGGGLFYAGSNGVITDSTFQDNSVTSRGGGISNYGGLTLNRVTLSGNQVTSGSGGGIDNENILTLINVTISGNSVSGAGSGLFSLGAAVSLDHCTLANNTASMNALFYVGSGQINLHNTILVTNASDQACVLQSGTSLYDQGYNLSSDESCGFSTSVPFHDLINTDPKLEVLGDNGGPTLTMALLTGSPAIDVADPANSQVRDQRGYFRPVNGISDMGAYEFASFPLDIFIWLPLILKAP